MTSLTIKEKVEWGTHAGDQQGTVWYKTVVQRGFYEEVGNNHSGQSIRGGQVGYDRVYGPGFHLKWGIGWFEWIKELMEFGLRLSF